MKFQTATALARPLSTEDQCRITVELNIPMIEIVNRLYATGLWGNSPTKVVERLLCEAMKPHALPPPDKK